MNRAITIAFKGEANEILVGPEVAYSEQRRNFRKLKASLRGYDLLELWCSSSGRVKQYKFKSKVAASSDPETVITSEAGDGAPADNAPEGDLNDPVATKPLTKKQQAKADAAKRREARAATKKTAKK